MSFVAVEETPEGVTVVRIDRPKANALSAAVLGELRDVADSLAASPPGAVVVTGGERIFSAGADISELTAPAKVTENFAAALAPLAGLPRAVIAAINGYALGGGLELALACDIRIAADDATLGLPEVTLGVIPGGGGTARLARLVGPAKAKELVLTGGRISGTEAAALGIVNRSVPRRPGEDAVFGAAMDLARELAGGARFAQGAAKEAIDRGLETTLEEAIAIEQEMFLAAASSGDAGRGVAAFLEGGTAKFEGR